MEKLIFAIHDNGKQIYRNQAGQYHNPVGPAFIHPNGFKAYLLNGKHHREDGPAVVHPNGDKSYFINGELHNENGPAVILSDRKEQYWLNNKNLSKEEWEQQVKQDSEVKEVTMEELHELLGYEVKIKEE